MNKRVLLAGRIERVGVELLEREGCQVVQAPGLSEDALKEAIADVDAIIVRHGVLTRGILQAARRLKVIGKHGVGTDNIDLEAATELGIAVCNAPEASTETTATLAFALMIAVSRRLSQAEALVKAGRWNEKDLAMGHDLHGKSVSILGYGRIGSCMARKCRAAFDMKVFAYSRRVSQEAMAADGVIRVESVDELMPIADFVSVHALLTPYSHGLIGARQFDLMKPTAYLINTSRGQIVDEAALIEALRQGKIAGAGLDVLEQEPPAPDNPLLHMENVVVLPHLGSSTREAMERLALTAASEVLAVLKGESPKYPVVPVPSR